MKRSLQFIGPNDYEAKGPIVLTHGDPHLDNIFRKINGSILYIDWEWAALASPLRDITILVQDLRQCIQMEILLPSNNI
ncbi:phosphotransferase [Bacillus sp. FJAT-49736]|uniref:phosphotransferase family protein n=1 Tax=Bacillus sp. FJAT-49736 TaxID=2833582 RepID=UPI001BCA4812|nr:phosphotransferase [Bacillus sp. FJAT-49736]